MVAVTVLSVALAVGGRTVESKSVVLPAGGLGIATAVCPSGDYVTGGGFVDAVSWPPNSGGETWVESEALVSAGRGWSVEGKDYQPATAITALAYCTKGTAPSLKKVSKTVKVSDRGLGTSEVQCPAGTVVLNGGFTVTFPTYKASWAPVQSAYRPSPTSWKVSAVNGFDPGSIDITATAYCGKGATPKQVVSPATTVQPSSMGDAVAKCPLGKPALFGGFSAQYDPSKGITVDAISLTSPTASEWKVTGGNWGIAEYGGVSGTILSYAYCA